MPPPQARLAQLRPDVLKIDRCLVHGRAQHPGRRAVIVALVAYADALGVQVCAEGVELVADLDALRALVVHHAQGFLLGRPSTRWAAERPALPHQPTPLSSGGDTLATRRPTRQPAATTGPGLGGAA